MLDMNQRVPACEAAGRVAPALLQGSAGVRFQARAEFRAGKSVPLRKLDVLPLVGPQSSAELGAGHLPHSFSAA